MKKALLIILSSLLVVSIIGIAYQLNDINYINYLIDEASSAHSVIIKRVADNKDEMLNINTEAEKLGNKIMDFEIDIIVHEKVLDDLNRDISQKESHIAVLQSEFNSLDESVNELDISLKEFEEKVEELNNRITELSN